MLLINESTEKVQVALRQKKQSNTCMVSKARKISHDYTLSIACSDRYSNYFMALTLLTLMMTPVEAQPLLISSMAIAYALAKQGKQRAP